MSTLPLPVPGFALPETYRAARHDSLNFEACGGERHSRDDFALRPYGQMIFFPAKVAKRVIERFNRKEGNMSDHDEATSQSREATSQSRKASASRAGAGERQRKETFVSSGPVRAKVSTRSGDVTVHVGKGHELEVTLSVNSAKNEHLLELAEVRFDAKSNELEILTQPAHGTASKHGVRVGSKMKWFDFGRSDLDVLVVLPQQSSLEVSTVSGDLVAYGSLDHVEVSSASGDVRLNDSSTTLDVRTASGDVKTGRVLESLKCKSASGDVDCLGAASKTEIMSASGDVVVSADRPGDVLVRAVSGDVKVRVARGLSVDVNGQTVSGEMGSNIDLDASGDAMDDEDALYIKVNTVSGDIRIDKAS